MKILVNSSGKLDSRVGGSLRMGKRGHAVEWNVISRHSFLHRNSRNVWRWFFCQEKRLRCPGQNA